MKFCPNCGAEVKEGAMFCGSCGAKMAPQANPTAEAPFAEEPATEFVHDPQPVAEAAPAGEIKDMKVMAIIFIVASFVCGGGILAAAAAGGMWYFNNEALKLAAEGNMADALAKDKIAKILMIVWIAMLVFGMIVGTILVFTTLLPLFVAMMESMMIVL